MPFRPFKDLFLPKNLNFRRKNAIFYIFLRFLFVLGSFWNKWRNRVNELLEQWQWVSRLFDDVSFFDFRSLIWRVFRPRSLAWLLNQYVPFVLSHLSMLSSQQPYIIFKIDIIKILVYLVYACSGQTFNMMIRHRAVQIFQVFVSSEDTFF